MQIEDAYLIHIYGINETWLERTSSGEGKSDEFSRKVFDWIYIPCQKNHTVVKG